MPFQLLNSVINRAAYGALAGFIALAASAYAAEPIKPVKKPSVTSAPTKEMVTLGTIDGESDTEWTLLNLRFDKKPSHLRELQDHGAFLQLILPNTIVPEPGKFIDGNSPYIPKVAVFQLTATDAGVRFFVNQDASKTKEATSIEILDKRIVLTVDHAALKAKLTSAVKTVAAIPTAEAHAMVEADNPADSGAAVTPAAPISAVLPAASTPVEPGYEVASLQADMQVKSDVSAEEVIAKTEVQTDIPEPAAVMKNETPAMSFGPPKPERLAALKDMQPAAAATAEAALAKQDGFDFREKLLKVAGFSGVMLFVLAIVLWMKPVLRRRRVGKHVDESAWEMKTLASMPLAARQKLSLIQIGDERILIGITPENISLITVLGAQNGANSRAAGFASQRLSQQAFKGMLGAESHPLLEMQQAPKLKNIPGNDEASLSGSANPLLANAAAAKTPTRNVSHPAKASTKSQSSTAKPAVRMTASQATTTAPAMNALQRKPSPSRINIAVTEDGVKDLLADKKSSAPASAKGIEDVTMLIREKIKNLRTI